MTNVVNPIGLTTSLGINVTIKVTPTITASSAYSANQVIGGVMTLPAAVRQLNGHSRLEGITLLDRANQKPGGTLFIFESDVVGANWADKATPTITNDDLVIAAAIPVSTADWVTITNASGGNRAIADVPYAGRLIQSQDPTDTNLYAVFVTNSAPTFNTNNDFKLEFKFSYAD